MNQYIIQGIGAIAYILLGISYYRKEKRQMLLTQIFSLLAFSIHYYLLNGITGAVCNIISMVMMTIIYFYDKNEKNNKKILVMIMIPVLIIIALLSWENASSFLPILSSTIMLIAFLLENPNDIRIISVVSNLSWAIYGFIHKSYIAMLFETIILGVSIGAVFKNDKKQERKVK